MITDEDKNEMACIICPITPYGYAYCDMECEKCKEFIRYKKDYFERGNKNE